MPEQYMPVPLVNIYKHDGMVDTMSSLGPFGILCVLFADPMQLNLPCQNEVLYLFHRQLEENPVE